jgi:hypothetical protein
MEKVQQIKSFKQDSEVLRKELLINPEAFDWGSEDSRAGVSFKKIIRETEKLVPYSICEIKYIVTVFLCVVMHYLMQGVSVHFLRSLFRVTLLFEKKENSPRKPVFSISLVEPFEKSIGAFLTSKAGSDSIDKYDKALFYLYSSNKAPARRLRHAVKTLLGKDAPPQILRKEIEKHKKEEKKDEPVLVVKKH